MQNLKKILQQKLNNCKRLAILGIGSELMGDDAVGVYFVNRFNEARVDEDVSSSSYEAKAFYGGSAPESMTGEIRKFNPSHLLIIDAANLNQKPGTIELVNSENIEGVSFSTHRLPTRIFMDYLVKSIGCEVLILGIQPKSMNYLALMNSEIEKSMDLLLDIIIEGSQAP